MSAPVDVAFVLLHQFHMMALTSAIEPLRVANLLTNKSLFSWSLYSVEPGPVCASNGMTVGVKGRFDGCSKFDLLFVCASFFPEKLGSKQFFAWLRKLDRQGKRIGAMDTGTIILARAGLLGGVKATANYDVLQGLAESYPDIIVTDHLFDIDGNKMTCAGGTASIDMMLNVVRMEYGLDLASRVSSHMFHDRIRSDRETQFFAIRHHGLTPSAPVRRAIEAMEKNIEMPISIDEIAQHTGSTVRGLRQSFHRYFRLSPTEFYMRVRLERARQYLIHTEMSILNVAIASGFLSQEHFARRFRRLYGYSPRAERAQYRAQATGAMVPIPVLEN